MQAFSNCDITGQPSLSSMCNISLSMWKVIANHSICMLFLFFNSVAISSVGGGEVIMCNIFCTGWHDLAGELLPAESTVLLCPFEQNSIRLARLSLSMPWQICRTSLSPRFPPYLSFHIVHERRSPRVTALYVSSSYSAALQPKKVFGLRRC